MAVSDPSVVKSSDLVNRVKGILLSPLTEWETIDAEPATVGGIYTGYVVILAAIGPIAQLIHSLVFGFGALGFAYRPPVTFVLVSAVVGYVMTLVMVYIVALIIDALATNFGGQKSKIQALKVAVYSSTAAWVSQIFFALPILGVLGLLGLYSFYLLYLGLPRLMKAPQAQALSYTIVTVVITVVVGVVIFGVVGAIEAPFLMAGMAFHTPSPMVGAANGGTFTAPNGASVNLGQLGAAANQMQAAAEQMKAAQTGAPPPAGAIRAVAPDALKALLPDSLNGFSRTEVSSGGGGVAGMSASTATATYAKGDGSVSLAVADSAAMGAMAAMAGVTQVQSDKETATGYEKVGQVNGRLTTESYDHESKHGEYTVMVANRFMVTATGDNVSIDDLKAAVASIGLDRLEGLAHSG